MPQVGTLLLSNDHINSLVLGGQLNLLNFFATMGGGEVEEQMENPKASNQNLDCILLKGS